MATLSLLKASQLIVSKRRENSDGNLNFTKPVKLFVRPRFTSVKVHNFIHLTSDITTTTGNNAAAVPVPFKSKVQFGSSNLKVSQSEKPVTNYVFEFLNLLKVPAVAVVHSLFLLLLVMVVVNRRGSALAFTPPLSTGQHESLSGRKQYLFEVNVKVSMPEDVDTLSRRLLQSLATTSYGQKKVAVKKEVDLISGIYMDMFIGLLAFIIGPSIFFLVQKYRESRLKVIKLQVGLIHVRSSFFSSLDEIAETSDTSTEAGNRDLLETLSELFIPCDRFWMAASSLVKVCKNIEDAEKSFKQLLVERRGDFDEELVPKKGEKRITSGKEFGSLYLSVITFVVAAKGEGVPGFPDFIWNKEQLKVALRKLQTISTSGEIQALGILSSHRNSDKIGSVKALRRVLKEKYPRMRFFAED